MLTEKLNSANLSDSVSLSKILATFFCVITIRTFLDSYAYTFVGGYLLSWEHYLHSLLYLSSIFLSFSILLFFLTKDTFKNILSFLSKVSLVILIVPFVDLLINRTPIHSLYVTVGNNGFLQTFFKLMNPLNELGVTKGIYFSAYLTLILFFIFVHKKTHNYYRAFSAVFLGFLVFFCYSILPSVILLSDSGAGSEIRSNFAYLFTLKQSWLGKDFFLDAGSLADISANMNVLYEIVITRIYWLLMIIQSSFILFISNKKIWHCFLKNSRMERIANYSLIATIGIVLADKISGNINFTNSINTVTLICFFVLLGLSAWFTAFINDNEDIAIDAISNPERPLVDKSVPEGEWVLLNKYIFIFMFSGFLLMDKQVSFLLILAQCAFYIYSVPPLRLKKHFIYSSIIMGFTTIVIAMSGFFLVAPDQLLLAFPLKALFVIGFSYALLSNIKDVKDYAGDKSEKMRTLPVVFGLKNSKIIIAASYALVFICVPILLELNALLPFAVVASAFVFYLLTKKVYQEKYIFYTKFIYMILLYLLTK